MAKRTQEKTTSQQLADFLALTRAVVKEYDGNVTELNACEKATQDLLHQLELGSYHDRGRFSTKLANVRKTRRKYKDYIDIHAEFYEYLKSKECITVLRQLEQHLGKLRNKEDTVNSKRQYRARVVKDLTISKK